MKKHQKLLLALILGIVVGSFLHPYHDVGWLSRVNTFLFQPVGQIFLRLIFMIVVPMIFSALVLGAYELGRARGIGSVAGKTLLYTIVSSTASVLIGITLVNLIQPGRGLAGQVGSKGPDGSLQKLVESASQAKPLHQIVVELVTKNPLDSALRALEGEMLAFMIFALLFGIGLVMSQPKGTDSPIVRVLEQAFAACMAIVEIAMKLAPVAVFCIVFGTAFKNGLMIFGSLGVYVGVVVLGLLIQQFVVYSTLLAVVARRSPWQFFGRCKEVYLYAFSTASSNATLPRSIETAEKKLMLPPEISRFVLTIGATANQNGTALFEGVTVLFLAQVYGIDLNLSQQLQVVFMSIIAGVGTAGVPGGSLPLILILLQSVGIPAEGMGLILGVDRFLDMCRTTVNVSGDLVIAALVSKNRG